MNKAVSIQITELLKIKLVLTALKVQDNHAPLSRTFSARVKRDKVNEVLEMIENLLANE